jgi:hypothetical protein
MHESVSVYSPIKCCSAYFGISEAELHRYVSACWVRTKKSSDSQQGHFDVLTSDIWCVVRSLSRGVSPRVHRKAKAILSWNDAAHLLAVRFE